MPSASNPSGPPAAAAAVRPSDVLNLRRSPPDGERLLPSPVGTCKTAVAPTGDVEVVGDREPGVAAAARALVRGEMGTAPLPANWVRRPDADGDMGGTGLAPLAPSGSATVGAVLAGTGGGSVGAAGAVAAAAPEDAGPPRFLALSRSRSLRTDFRLGTSACKSPREDVKSGGQVRQAVAGQRERLSAWWHLGCRLARNVERLQAGHGRQRCGAGRRRRRRRHGRCVRPRRWRRAVRYAQAKRCAPRKPIKQTVVSAWRRTELDGRGPASAAPSLLGTATKPGAGLAKLTCPRCASTRTVSPVGALPVVARRTKSACHGSQAVNTQLPLAWSALPYFGAHPRGTWCTHVDGRGWPRRSRGAIQWPARAVWCQREGPAEHAGWGARVALIGRLDHAIG